MSELTNAQAALLAAGTKKYSVLSHTDEINKTLIAAERYKAWLDDLALATEFLKIRPDGA